MFVFVLTDPNNLIFRRKRKKKYVHNTSLKHSDEHLYIRFKIRLTRRFSEFVLQRILCRFYHSTRIDPRHPFSFYSTLKNNTCTLYLYIDNFILGKDHRNKVFKAKENIVFFSNSTLFHVTKSITLKQNWKKCRIL